MCKEDTFIYDSVFEKTYTEYNGYSLTSLSWKEWVPCKSDGQFFIKDGKKYFRVKKQNDTICFMSEDQVQFLQKDSDV